MKGSSRRRSRAATTGDVAELLRHLSDDRWLSAHPYASEFTARLPQHGASSEASSIAVLRSNALLAVGRLRQEPVNGERLHTIVSRCDLGGELHKAIASELGLSRRQFYRDLAYARGLVDRDVRAAVGTTGASGAPDPCDDARFKTAIVLAAGGHGKAAVEHFAPAVDALEGLAAVWGHSIIASLLLDDGNPQSAQREVDLASERCNGAAGTGAELIELARAKLYQQTGRPAEALQALEDVATALESHRYEGSQLSVDALSETLALLAFCRHERGDFADAARLNAKNPAGLGSVRVSPFARRYYLNVDAMLACDGRAGPAMARQSCDDFYRFAVSNGFLDDVSAALLQLAGIARFERRLDDAERLARESLSIQRTIGGSDAPILGMLTGVAIDAGLYEPALALARETRERATTGSHVWWGAQLHEAEALARSAAPAKALQICTRVARASDDRDSRLAAWRRRVEATVFKVLGNDDEAYRAAGVSLEILGDHAPPFHRLRSLLVAADARPNRSHHAEIRNLTAVLGWTRRPSRDA